MAKKKVSKKKTTRTTGRKAAGSGAKSKARTMKKTAPSSSKKKRGKTAKKSASGKSTTKKKSSPKKSPTKKSSTKKGSSKKGSSKKTPTRKKTVSQSAAKKTTSQTTNKKTTLKKVAAKTTRKTLGKRGKTVVNPIPDSDGYVMINGRRVRMMSATAPPPPARKVTRKKPTPATMHNEVKSKPIKTRLKSKQLDEFRDLLLVKRSELVGDLSALEEQALKSGGGNSSHMPIHMADIGSDTYDQDFMLGLAETERKGLREIDGALRRIADGTYGICQLTGKPIPKARLNAKPWAKYTIEAARMIESGLDG